MSDKKSRWVLWGLGLACAACCALPIYILLGGVVAGVGASFLSPAIKEVLICVLPLMIVGLVVYFMNRHKKLCCDTPQSGCNNQQCEVKNHD